MKQVKRNKLIVPALFLILICVTCAKEKIPEETLVKVYVENVIAGQTFINSKDSLNIQKAQIFKKYGINENEFKSEIAKYYEQKDKWTVFFKKSNEYLDELRKSGAIK